jgi:hypothetical protein
MPSSSAAARNYRIGSQRLTSARARSERTGVTPLPPGGASAGAFGAKLATLALDYYANRGKVSAEEIKAQADAEYRDLQTAKLRRDLAQPEEQTYSLDGVGGLKGSDYLTQKRLAAPKVATPDALVPEEERAVLGLPPEIKTWAGARQFGINKRAQQGSSDLAKARFESETANRALAKLDVDEKQYANEVLVKHGDPALQSLFAAAASPDKKVAGKAFEQLGLNPKLAESQTTATRDLVQMALKNLQGRWANFARYQAGQRFGPERQRLKGRLEGLRATMPAGAAEEAPEAVEAIDPRARDY